MESLRSAPKDFSADRLKREVDKAKNFFKNKKDKDRKKKELAENGRRMNRFK